MIRSDGCTPVGTYKRTRQLPYFHTTGEGKDDVCFLLSQLDAANQTIARQETDIQELWEQKRIMSGQWLDHDATIRRLSKTIADKNAEIERLRQRIQRVFEYEMESPWKRLTITDWTVTKYDVGWI